MKELIRKIPLISNIIEVRTYLRYRDTLLQNQKYRDIYKGKRCFIIGNGPSLRNHNLGLLRNELTISVNSFTKTPEYDVVKPKFHILVDSTKFDPNIPSMVENMKSIKSLSHKSTFVVPAKYQEYLRKNGFLQGHELIFTYSNSNKTKISNIDFTHSIPPYKNVINVALYLAIYLGCSEIYLIGCDMTGFIKTFDEDNNFSVGGHFYNPSVKEKDFIDALQSSRSNEMLLKSYGCAFEIFRLTKEYADKKNIKIYNAGIGGTLDVFPRISYEKIISE